MMKKKQLGLFLIGVFTFSTLIGCNAERAEDATTVNPFGNQGDRGKMVDEYQLNEEEQLTGRGQMSPPANPYGSISNASTTIPSSKYPHTKAVEIQAAKYKFVVDSNVNIKQGKTITQRNIANVPKVQQTPAPTTQTEAPKQPAPKPAAQPTPAPNVTTPTPATQQPAPAQTKTPAPVEQPNTATPTPAQPAQQSPAPTATAGISEMAQKVIELTNAERQKNNLPAYQADAQLSGVAKMKSDDMQKNNYFSHTSPTHGSPFDMIRDQGVTYRSAGENIAKGQPTAEQVVRSWMNSEGHRKNILSGDFTHIGVGYNQQGHYWTQMFIKK